jgi:arrestin-2
MTKGKVSFLTCDVLTGIALDGHLKDEDVNLASSTMVAEGKAVEAMGIVVSYSVRVELNCGTLGGALSTDVPLKLLNPAPGNYL